MDYVEIPLRAVDGSVRAYALVDPEDADRVSACRWHLDNWGYAIHGVRKNGKRIARRMHRFVLGLPDRKVDDREVDHINGNPLDNRKSNLRITTVAGNAQNRVSKPESATSKYRGVYWDASNQRWRARCYLNRRAHHLGYFDSEDEAGRAAAEWRAVNMPFANEQRHTVAA